MKTMISIKANGDAYELEPDTPLPAFLESLQLSVERVVVEKNQEPLTQKEASATVLSAGDELEIVRIVAGG